MSFEGSAIKQNKSPQQEWGPYFKKVGMEPGRLVQATVEKFHQGPLKRAADLGAGNLRNARWLVDHAGCEQVVAIDVNNVPDKKLLTPEIEFHQMSVGDYEPEPNSLDFVLCDSVLFFVSPEEVRRVLAYMRVGLRAGGTFSGNVLGAKDGWVAKGLKGKYAYPDEESVRALAEGFEILACVEEEHDAPEKHWHTWTLVLRKV